MDQLFVSDAQQSGWHFDRVQPIKLRLLERAESEVPAMYSIFCVVEQGADEMSIRRLCRQLNAEMEADMKAGMAPIDVLKEMTAIGRGYYDRVRNI